RRRHTRWPRDWSSDVCSSDLDWRHSPGRLRAKLLDCPRGVRVRHMRLFFRKEFHRYGARRSFETEYLQEREERQILLVRGRSRRSEERRVGKEGTLSGARQK